MYAITIRQPYASLIMAGIKTIETRTRDTKIRGRVLIHSGRQWAGFLDASFVDYVNAQKLDIFINSNFPKGKILGSVEITDSLPAGDWIEEHKGKGGNVDKVDI